MNKQIMTHIVAGYPSLKASEEIALTMIEVGVYFIEIQIPFSDPVADGPVIMQANEKALKAGTKVEDCFKLMEKLCAKNSTTKFLFMSYFNILHSYGVEKFCKKAQECGCYGLIVPDMPLDEEEHEHYLENCQKFGLKAVQVVSPLSTDERLKKIAKVASGLVYCISRYGTTGVSSTLNTNLSGYLRKVKKYIQLPLAVGFGISDKSHVQAVWQEAEIAVIGSKVVRLIDEGGNYLPKIEKFLKQIKDADRK
ncbi:MAG: tryptophan synthase subunit alpha [Patescibacteria group bacterium]